MYSYEDRRCANAVSFVWNTTFAPLSWSGRKFHNYAYRRQAIQVSETARLFHIDIIVSTEVLGSIPIKAIGLASNLATHPLDRYTVFEKQYNAEWRL
jgi:hypothetical protein